MPDPFRAIPLIATFMLVGCGDGIDTGVQHSESDPRDLAQSSSTCLAAEHSRFDFLVGSWSITYEDEDPFAEFEIEKSADGCTLNGVGKYADGDTRTFFGFYDPATQLWKQAWISGDFMLEVQGARDSRDLQLAGTLLVRSIRPEPLSARLRHELQADGTIREYLPFSIDDGKSWRVGRSAVWSPKNRVN